MIVAVGDVRQVVLAADFVDGPTTFEVEFVDFGLSLCVESLQGEFADVNTSLAKVTRRKEFRVQLVLMLTDARLNGAQQELLRGVFRHTVVAAAVAHNGDDLRHTHQSAECFV